MYSDGEGTLATLIILGLIGVAVGFGAAAYIDSQDGEMFNGDVKWYDYLGASVAGGLLGLGAGWFAGLSWSFTIPTFGFVNTGGALAIGITGTTAITITGTQILTGVGAAGLLLMMAKNTRLSGKQTSSDKPSWVNGNMIDKNLNPQQNATKILNDKYGEGNWRTGPKTEFNKIVKWIIRWLLRG